MEENKRYEARKALGAGGMGEVFLAHDRELDRLVALKLVNEDVSKDILARFDRECDVMERLEHPAIVPILDRGRLASGRYYYTMPFIDDSKNMTTWMRAHFKEHQPPVPAKVVLELLEDVAGALDYIHAQGVFHRDIKPSNILVVPPGKGLLIDFGLAGLVNSELTKTGTIVGTMGYLSPEQAAGGDADGASDRYQLGLVIYHLATGHRASTDAFSYVSDMAQGKTPFPPATEREPRVGPALDAIIARATQLKPSDRFESARAMMDAIRAAGDGWVRAESPRPRVTAKTPRVTTSVKTVAARPAAPAASGATRWAVGAVALIACFAAAVALLRPGVKLSSPVQALIGFDRAQVRFTTDRPTVARVRWTAPGRAPAIVADEAPATDHRLTLAPLEPRATHTYDVLLAGDTVASHGSIEGPAAPEVRTLTAEQGKDGLAVAVQLTVPAGGAVHASAGGRSGSLPLGPSATAHRVTFAGWNPAPPVEIRLTLTSPLGESVELPPRAVTPRSAP